MAKIIVGGCSFSDRRYGLIPWGEQVADYYNCEYLHEAASAGSNYRIWRKLTAHIMNKNISSNDIIIVQYTLVDRKESWSPLVHVEYEHEQISEPFDNGTLVRLTPHFDQFAKNKYEKHLALCHNYFSNHNYNLECFWTQHHMFKEMCAKNNITVRYLNTIYDRENRIEDIDATLALINPDHRLDDGHLNQLGHDCTAQLVIQSLSQSIAPN